MTFYLDFSTNYQISFQDPATPIMNGIIDLHHYVMFFLFIVLIFVVINLYNIVKFFNIEIKFSKNKTKSKYFKKLFIGIKSINNKLKQKILYYIPVKNKNHDLYLNKFETNKINYQKFLIKYIQNNYFSNSRKLKINPKNIFFCYILNLMYYTKLYVILKSGIFRFIHDSTIEIIWTIIPSVILIFIGLPSFILLYAMDEIIEPDFVIKCIGHQWYWSYEIEYPKIQMSNSLSFDMKYTNINQINENKDIFLNIIDKDLLKIWSNILIEQFKIEDKWDYLSFDSYMINESELPKGALRLLEVDNALIMPAGTHIDLLISSSDVLHCWTIPSFGLKVDAVPGRINHANVYIERTGIFYGQCSEICGVNHGFMPIKVIVLPLKNFMYENFNI